MITPALAASRYATILSGINLVPVTLMSRQPMEGQYASYPWYGRELPDTQVVSVGDAIISERHKKIQLVKQAQTVDPKEGDDLSIQFGLLTGPTVRYTIQSMDIGFNRFVFTCQTLFSTNANATLLISPPSAVMLAILNETVAALQTIPLNSSNGAVPIVIRKAPKMVLDVDPVTQITVSCQPQFDRLTWFAFPNTVKMVYSITLTLVNPFNFDDSANLAAYGAWRQQVRTKFAKPGAYTAPVFDQNFIMGAFESRSELTQNYDWHICTIEVITTEPGS